MLHHFLGSIVQSTDGIWYAAHIGRSLFLGQMSRVVAKPISLATSTSLCLCLRVDLRLHTRQTHTHTQRLMVADRARLHSALCVRELPADWLLGLFTYPSLSLLHTGRQMFRQFLGTSKRTRERENNYLIVGKPFDAVSASARARSSSASFCFRPCENEFDPIWPFSPTLVVVSLSLYTQCVCVIFTS